MKKILFSLIALLGVMGAKADTTWDFTSVSDADKALISADTKGNWYEDTSKGRFNYFAALSEQALTANGSELDYAKGLLFTCGAGSSNTNGKIRLNYTNGRLELNGNKIVITIPGLKAGQTITIASISGNSDTERGLVPTNVTVTSGFKNSKEAVTNIGTVTADGNVTITTDGGGVNITSISITESSGSGQGETPSGSNDVINNAVSINTNVNQAMFTLANGDIKYYNTESLSSIDIDNSTNQVNVKSKTGSEDIYYGTINSMTFKKKAESGSEGQYDNVEGKVNITEAKGWLESAYVKWDPFTNATSYVVYIKGGQYGDWTKLDDPLVRNYGSYGRADAVGLIAGSDYAFKVVPVLGDATTGSESNANEASGISVKNYDRAGYAHFNYSGVGAYDDNGQLKSGAKVFYVTKNTAKTISTNVAGAANNPCVGLQAIITGYEKGGDTTPIAFRFIGNVDISDLDAIGSKEEGIQVKGRKGDSQLNLTFEGIGDDATITGFGFLVRNSKSIEFRNLGIMRCMDDGLSLDTDNSNIWIHNIDVFYGKHGSGDHAKGDGAIDVKSDSKYVTVSYCRFWDTGKSNMFGMKSESGPNYISYHHNWFDHSDSRHPRVRTMSVHVWNNYFDNVAKYGVGATSGASVFVENNYFLKTKKPILSSLQGTDAQGSGTFSGEEGGMIKAYGNYFDRSAKNFKYYTQKNPASTGYDAYETDSRDEQVPSSEVTKSGSHSYNNFDTDPSKMYSYTPDAAEDVPAIVTGYYGAGRMNHGDFTYTFSDNIGSDDADSEYDSMLGSLLDNYKSSLVGIFGDESSHSGEQGGGEQGEGEQGGNTPVQEGTIVCTFGEGFPSNSMFTVGGSYGDGKITYDGINYKKGVKLDSKGSIAFTPAKNYNMTLVMGTAKNGRDVKLNGNVTTQSGTENTEGAYYEIKGIPVSANTEYTLTKGSAEGLVMIIKLEPVE